MTRRSVSHTPLHKNCKGAKSSLLLHLCNFILRQIARYLPHHRSENASKTHPKSSHDKFKTASTFAA